MMLISVECFEELDHIGVAEHFKNADLIIHLLLAALIFHKFHVDGFDGNEAPSQTVKTQVHTTESTFAQHFSYFVETKLGLGWFAILLETFLD